ncbi:MAG: amino acid ABC transporter permease [Treponema sp.]|nr:amino acid ABC transporter permease [Treponema sp.]
MSLTYLFEDLLSGAHFIHVTMLLGIIPLFIGLVLGTLIALVRLFRIPVFSRVLEVFVVVYSGVPIMVSLIIYYLLYLLFIPNFNGGVLIVAYFALSLNRSVLLSEVIRGAFLAIPKIQYEAAYSCGLTLWQTLSRIIIPQMIPVALPPLTNNVVGGIKNTSVVMAVGLIDVLNGSTLPCTENYSYVEGYIAAGIIYWLISIVVEFFLHHLELNFSKHECRARA